MTGERQRLIAALLRVGVDEMERVALHYPSAGLKIERVLETSFRPARDALDALNEKKEEPDD